MVKCELCKREMTSENYCSYDLLIAKDGEVTKRFTGSDGFHKEGSTCLDCGIIVKKGNYHHKDCDNETCPKCKGQLITCGCFMYYSSSINKKKVKI